ncbi:MAG: ABC transporter substrate-binding protein [Burkholderiaceae bacterium]|nr:ABC transporter substrate-binding protein [Burkholderiaceae bacterium]
MDHGNEKKIPRRKPALAAFALLAAMVVGTSAPAQAQQAEIRIGFVNPSTGAFGALGKAARKGMDLAIANAAANPKLKDIRFVVEERDSAAKSPDAIRYARELIQRENVDVLMGGLSSAECLSLQKLAPEVKIAYLPTSGCWADEFANAENVNRYAFRVTASNKQRNFAFADWLVKNSGKNWYVIYSDFAYGQSGLKAFQEAMAAAGGKVTGSIGIPFGATDMASYISKIDRSADGLYFVLAGRDAILALQEVASQGLARKMKLAGMQSLIVPENFPEIPASAEGLSFIGAYPRDATGALDTPENHAFRKAFAAKYPGEIVGLNTFEAYQATNVLLAAIERSGFKGRKDTDKLVEALSGLKVQASAEFPAGPVTVRASDHQGVAPLYIAVVKDGKEQVIHTIPAAEVDRIK